VEITRAIEIVGERMFRNVMDNHGYRSLLRKMRLPELPLPVEVVLSTDEPVMAGQRPPIATRSATVAS
jgi:hypothetical protein